jgi:hypothetical protein
MIAIALFLEFLLIPASPWPHGEMGSVRYRHQERFAAFIDYRQHPSPATKATFDEEMRLLHEHEDWRPYLEWSLIMLANGACIYYFWGYGNLKTPA